MNFVSLKAIVSGMLIACLTKYQMLFTVVLITKHELTQDLLFWTHLPAGFI